MRDGPASETARKFAAQPIVPGVVMWGPGLIRQANANARKAGVADCVAFREEDLLQANRSEAAVVTLFLSPDANGRLKQRLRTDLRPGTRIVRYWQDMPTGRPERSPARAMTGAIRGRSGRAMPPSCRGVIKTPFA